MLRIPRARASWIAGNCSGPAPTTNKLGIKTRPFKGMVVSLLCGLSKLVRQHGKQETVDEATINKHRRTQFAFFNKAKPTVKADRGLVGHIDLEKDPMQSQRAE